MLWAHSCKSAPLIDALLLLLLEPPSAVVFGCLKGFISVGMWGGLMRVRPLASLSAGSDGSLYFGILSCVDLLSTSRRLSICRLMKLKNFNFITRAVVRVAAVGYDDVGVVVRQVMVVVVVVAVGADTVVLALRGDVVAEGVG